MVFARIFRARGLAAALLIGSGAGMMSGCATTQVTVQWSDPEFAGRSLRGEKVLVVCDAPDAAIRGACQDQVAAQVRASGGTPVISPDAGLTVGPPPANDRTLAAARTAGAKAIFGSTIGPDATYVSPGASVGIGVGGYSSSGGYRGGSATGGSVDVGFPVGGGQATTGYAANMVLTDVATVRLMWTSKITTPPSQNVGVQIGELARVGVEAARAAGFF